MADCADRARFPIPDPRVQPVLEPRNQNHYQIRFVLTLVCRICQLDVVGRTSAHSTSHCFFAHDPFSLVKLVSDRLRIAHSTVTQSHKAAPLQINYKSN